MSSTGIGSRTSTEGDDERPLRRDAELNRQRIIEAAREVFAERGLAATFDEVAHRAGVGIGTVYRRFPTKEALLAVAFEERLREHARMAEEALAAPTGWEALVHFLRQAAGMHAEDRGLRDLALGASAELGFSPHERIRDSVEPIMRRIIERAHEEGSLRADVTVEDIPLLLMMVSEVAHHSHAVRPEAYHRYLQLLIDGLRRSSKSGNLGAPMTPDDVEAMARQWLPTTLPRR
ncbi:TetR/AcrR family transcriptional regulator [Actinoplanes sp. LDG1-06]|uniref:TetR/AcrR family transcriptional regulator n=1 Tax=Paractinoplanes ovalisporus TaxID=2810368 RepID=A0ABS2A631_9ACTN|nr:TetR/AcrR family transcriptional regulator [Actinoplanes ovalisporus]MBM2614753.1 TetR/AcrR family transcriptional regulator [Actinoplanes ovalisporus]